MKPVKNSNYKKLPTKGARLQWPLLSTVSAVKITKAMTAGSWVKINLDAEKKSHLLVP